MQKKKPEERKRIVGCQKQKKEEKTIDGCTKKKGRWMQKKTKGWKEKERKN